MSIKTALVDEMLFSTNPIQQNEALKRTIRLLYHENQLLRSQIAEYFRFLDSKIGEI